MSFQKHAVKTAWVLAASFITFFGWMVFQAYSSSSAQATVINRAVETLDKIELRMASSERRDAVHDEQIKNIKEDLESLPPADLTGAVKEIQTTINEMQVDIATIKAKQGG